MIIDTSNAPCGPGFLPGLRLSEGRFAINRGRPAFSAVGAVAGARRLRPPKFRPSRRGCPLRRGGPGRLARPPRPVGCETPLPFPPSPAARRERGALSGLHVAGAAAGGQPGLRAARVSSRLVRQERSSGGSRGKVGGGRGRAARSARARPPPLRGTPSAPPLKPVSLPPPAGATPL